MFECLCCFFFGCADILTVRDVSFNHVWLVTCVWAETFSFAYFSFFFMLPFIFSFLQSAPFELVWVGFILGYVLLVAGSYQYAWGTG